ncbi:MAG: class I SAM-dependent methyltransferase [Burkholderiaceae bacterium]|nr:class I SAM-dependent methyltransferase [Burkholderiaceae bacterium]
MNSPVRLLIDYASHPYQRGGKFAYHFARGKIRHDPVFFSILKKGLIPKNAKILDLGCGQGLLASLLDSAAILYKEGQWPSEWSVPVQSFQFRGIELMARDVARANAALSTLKNTAWVDQANICNADFGISDVVVILDVLHYISYEKQQQVLEKVHAALRTNGILLLRVGDAGAGWPFRLSNWVDHVVTTIRGHRLSQLYCRSLKDWLAQLGQLGFVVEALPMSQGTPFANVLLIAHVRRM